MSVAVVSSIMLTNVVRSRAARGGRVSASRRVLRRVVS